MNKVDIDIKLDLVDYVDTLENKMLDYTAKAATREAKSRVRKDTGELSRSIEYKVKNDHAIVGSELPYARAQEYGFPGTRYGFTPYMRPAAQVVADSSILRALAILASREALRESRV
jgi:phage gpG-like protein